MFACGHLCVRDLSSCEHERPQLTVRSRQPGGHLDAPRSPAGCRRGVHAGGPGVYGDRRTGTSATPSTLVTGMLPATQSYPLQARNTNLLTQPRSATPIRTLQIQSKSRANQVTFIHNPGHPNHCNWSLNDTTQAIIRRGHSQTPQVKSIPVLHVLFFRECDVACVKCNEQISVKINDPLTCQQFLQYLCNNLY